MPCGVVVLDRESCMFFSFIREAAVGHHGNAQRAGRHLGIFRYRLRRELTSWLRGLCGKVSDTATSVSERKCVSMAAPRAALLRVEGWHSARVHTCMRAEEEVACEMPCDGACEFFETRAGEPTAKCSSCVVTPVEDECSGAF